MIRFNDIGVCFVFFIVFLIFLGEGSWFFLDLILGDGILMDNIVNE